MCLPRACVGLDRSLALGLDAISFKMEAFLNWCASRGITWHEDLKLVHTDGEGGGVQTLKPIAQGATCFTVPRKVALSAESIGEKSLAASLAPKHALALAACEVKTKDQYAPWLALWPKDTEGTWQLNAETRSTLSWCRELGKLDADESAAAVRALSEVIKPGLIAAGRERAMPSEEEYRWGLGIVSSRAADVIISGEARPTILPLIDMMNHRSKHEATVVLSFDSDLDAVVAKVVAPDGVAAGMSLTINYGAKDNAQLLHGYGFACRPNPHDTVLVRVPIGGTDSGADPLALQRVAMLPRGLFDSSDSDGGSTAAFGMLSWQSCGGSFVPSLSADIRVLLAMASATSIEQMFGAMSMAAAAGQTNDEGHEEGGKHDAVFDSSSLPQAAWELLAKCCADTLDALPAPLAAPQEKVAEAGARIQRAAAVALEARRDLLKMTYDAAKEAVAASRTPSLN